jgi:hypothetical protein
VDIVKIFAIVVRTTKLVYPAYNDAAQIRLSVLSGKA